ncbi:MAG: RNA polymerase-binding protein DksA [Epsilonproteobacteria bacterium]|nr:RNA polymerase-binding protein DksA [Campylobacterota bacterium]OIO13230.1 MAG: molecular chaperone DnaK suppressor DksA [Helicobacteraceae bacterium CG1_02_36_14]PIP10447.1 MAG: molecular chaperone DnaK suppressor DksA [Sulfurimonas sp. CG23_combo_of_CG06-09_8_20_14_all_36_33]PIS26662.1 MAG: molecular chaperone DnaK suppressor DksA [Sulfurimonas sp. CG08_land_8_20_14_0_20_36_33]PIU33473.1 MAG: molecular chaperone DnaK suppressor DksA [Sulfurimonas sp. CG07_land_8_20_14_0_80_36_56]PIV04917.
MQASELKYFKDILESRKTQIIKNISGVNAELDQLSHLELNDEGDYASVNNNSMVESAIVRQQEQELAEINVTLGKIANGDYGICVMCEDTIGFQRLKVKPHAIYCIDCREIVEKTK